MAIPTRQHSLRRPITSEDCTTLGRSSAQQSVSAKPTSVKPSNIPTLDQGRVRHRPSLSASSTSLQKSSSLRKDYRSTNVPAYASNDVSTISATCSDTDNRKKSICPGDPLGQHTLATSTAATIIADPLLKATSRAPLVQSSAASGATSGTETRASISQLSRHPSHGRSVSTVAGVSNKPQFAAYQQHFSPRKPVPTLGNSANRSLEARHGPNFRSNSSQVSSVDERNIQADLPAQVIRIQDELLQLQLLYDGSQDSLQKSQHRSNAELERQFIALQADATRLHAEEEAYSISFNTAAVLKWLDHWDGGGGKEARALSQLISDIDDLTRFEGRYARVMAEFETWFDAMLQAVKRRSGDSEAEAGGHASFGLLIQPLGHGWRDEVAVLLRKLGAFSQTLDILGTATSGSRVQCILSTERLFVDNLLGELELATAIEATALRRQQTWIDSSVETLLDEHGSMNPPMNCNDHRRGVWAT